MAMNDDGNYEVRAASEHNRLYIDLSGRLSAADIELAAEMSVEAAEALDPDFDIITDLSGFKPPDPEAAGPIKEAQATLAEMGIDRVVRVADEETSAVVVNAFERRSRDVGYEGLTADSLAEAERMLE